MTGGVPARPGLGIVLILLMAACFATMDTAVKYVGAVLPILIVLLARYGVQAASMERQAVISISRQSVKLVVFILCYP